MSLVLHLNRIDEWSALAGLAPVLRRAAEVALTARGDREGEVSFTFVSAEEMRALNRRYGGRDALTDVLAFELGEGGDLVGDVYISPDAAAASAAARGLKESAELVRLVIHGALHLLGLDHPEDEGRESSEMFRLQEELLRALADH